jgi:hypothetical protein
VSIDVDRPRALTVHNDVVQGTLEWEALRRGMLTASVVGLTITPARLKFAANDTSRGLIATLAAERITDYTEETRGSFDMQRGTMDEPYAREVYSEHHAEATESGFMVLQWGDIRIGYSPDGLVGDDGIIEIKSRLQKIQLQTILNDTVPAGNMAQIQTGLLVSGRKWCDYVSYCGGMPLWTKRVLPDPTWQLAILDAAEEVEKSILSLIEVYGSKIEGLPPTERIDHYEGMEIH